MTLKGTPTQLVHTARLMLATRIDRYNDPNNLEWDWGSVTDKWERHALSAFMDLQATEAERDGLLEENARLKELVSNVNAWIGFALNDVKFRAGRVAPTHTDGYSYVEIPEWSMRQKLDETALGEK